MTTMPTIAKIGLIRNIITPHQRLPKSGISKGHVFRGIKRNDSLNEKITGKTINDIVKRRIKLIGLNPDNYGAHSLRSGFITECIEQGISLEQAMRFSGHRSRNIAHKYYRPDKNSKDTIILSIK